MAEPLEKARIAFTGKMASMTRKEAWRVARDAGAEATSCVSHRTTLLIVGMEGWPLLPDGAISLKLRRAEELCRAGCPIRILPETAFLEMIGAVPPAPPQRKSFAADEVCRILRIDAWRLRQWELFGLIRSRGGSYDFQDLISMQAIRDLVGNGVRPERIGRSLRDLTAILPGLDRPLAQLRMLADNPDLLLFDSGGKRFSPTGQLLFNFDGWYRTPSVVLPHDFRSQTPAGLFELGLDFMKEELYPEAAGAFQATLSLDPAYWQALLHLGDVMREMGILWAAEDYYREAASLAPAAVAAWCGLAAVEEELGEIEAAIASYEKALVLDPANADGHFNVALCFEKAGRRGEACKHWFAYLKLDPASASAQLARNRLSVSPDA